MAFRKHRPGEIVVEQTRDLAQVRKLLEQGAMITEGIEWPAACYLLAFDGDDAVGVVGVEPMLDAALIRSLYVMPSHRRRAIGEHLVAAARKAAHTRGSRQLYLFSYSPQPGRFFQRLGFEAIDTAELVSALKGCPQVDYYTGHPAELAQEVAYRLDISRDGIVER